MNRTTGMLKTMLVVLVLLVVLWFAAPALGLPGWAFLLALVAAFVVAFVAFTRREA